MEFDGGGHFGQAGHGDNIAADHHHEPRASRDPKLVDGEPKAAGPAAPVGGVGKREGGLGDADRESVEPVPLEQLQIRFRAPVVSLRTPISWFLGRI